MFKKRNKERLEWHEPKDCTIEELANYFEEHMGHCSDRIVIKWTVVDFIDVNSNTIELELPLEDKDILIRRKY